MRICVVGLEIGLTEEGIFVGSGPKSIARVCQVLSKTGHEVTIVTTPPRRQRGYGNVKMDWADIYVLPVGGSYPSARYGIEFVTKSLLKIRRLHQKKRFQIIVGYSAFSAIGLIPGIAGRWLGIPSVHTLDCPVDQGGSAEINGLFLMPEITRGFLSPVNLVISISENVRNSLLKIGFPQEKVRVVPLPVDIDRFNPSISGREQRGRFGIDDSMPLILLVGNLAEQKGTYVALEAMKRVVRQYPQAKLIITSELPGRQYSKREQDIKSTINHLGLESNIIRMGIIANMNEVMAASDLLIAPFLRINGISDYPLPVLEAMALGKPVIVTKVGGIAEVVKNRQNGILIEPGNAGALSEAIISLCQDRKLRQVLGENAAISISSNFSAQKVAQQIEMVYEEIIRKYQERKRR